MNIRQMQESSPRMSLHLRLSLEETRLLRSLADGTGMSVTGYLRSLIRRAGFTKVAMLADEARRA